MSKDDGDIVLDFFAGSATTAQAVMELNAADGGNRRFIQVQLPEPVPAESAAANAGFRVISDISRERIDRAGAAIEAQRSTQVDSIEGSIDTGFRSYKLSDTNFSKWRTSSDIDTDALQQRFLELRESSSADDATPDSLLTEILLKQGYSLTEKIASAEIAGLDIRTIGDNLVIAYLNELVKPTLDQLRALVDQGPARIIVLEDAFQGDDELKTNLAQLCKSKSIELWTA
jgi:adenine-specific DNA-methyltransferase